MIPLWIFAYGSLIWNPGFPVQRRVVGCVRGFRRGFFMRSIHHRGSVEAPGLVLALDADEGAVCQGSLLQVPGGSEEATLAYLRERELVSSAYRETIVEAEADGQNVRAITYVVDRDHDQYVRGLSHEEQIAIILQAEGGRGTNLEYLWQTYVSLQQAGIPDPEIDALVALVNEEQRERANQQLA